MKILFKDYLFWVGFLVRLALVATIAPVPVTAWYIPFLDVSLGGFSLDPWAVWLNQGGNPAAFPYGYVMWLAFLPLTGLFKILGLPLLMGYGATLIIADLGLLVLLRRMFPGKDRLLLWVYWLSPIVLLATYILGFNDLIPVCLLTMSMLYLRNTRLEMAGFLCAAAVSAKLSMALAVPFFLIYLFHNRALRQYSVQFYKGFVAGVLVLLVSFAFLANAGLKMLMTNPEMGKVFQLAINFSDNATVFLFPLLYLLMLYATWRVKRLNFELFSAMLGLAFLLVVLATPASPGWFIWAMPMLVGYQLTSDRLAIFLAALFSFLYVVSSVLLSFPSVIANFSGVLHDLVNVTPQWNSLLAPLVHTAMVATGIVLAVRIARETVGKNDYFRLSRRPFVLGIAGDSGAGKDTYSDALKGLFGGHSVTTLSGDDYHLWDRQKPMWQVMTHLNPAANDLEGFANDLVSLRDGKSVQMRHYDHSTGRMSRPFKIDSNDVIIASGLHALYLPILRHCYNLSVYLDIDEGLRRHFKIARDVHQRGHTLERVLTSFERREPDSERFIRTQAAHADLVLSLQPIHQRILEDTSGRIPIRFKLVAKSRHGLNEMSLTRVLIGVCGLHVDMEPNGDGSEVALTIEGETSALDIEMAAKMICPRIFDFLDIQPKWQDGVMGLMQLITLSHINQALTKRFI